MREDDMLDLVPDSRQQLILIECDPLQIRREQSEIL